MIINIYINKEGRAIMKKNIWDRCAPLYDFAMKSDRNTYDYMYSKISKSVADRSVLEIGSGTGRLARSVAPACKTYVATDYSEGMLAVAGKEACPDNLTFELADATSLPYPDDSFDVAIIANALHIIPDPIKALNEIRRVLKPGGLLIAPNFINRDMTVKIGIWAKFLNLIGVNFEHRWTEEGYIKFLEDNGWKLGYKEIIKTRVPMAYIECRP